MELPHVFTCLWAIVFYFSQADGNLSILESQTRLFEGDLKLGNTRNGVLSQRRKWPNGVIPYEIRSDYSDTQVSLIQTAMRRIEQSTCIRFVPRSGQSDYLYIQNTQDGCYTAGVGYRTGGTEMSLQASRGPNCMYHSVIVHELLHAVGLWHEHMRYDRDDYVKINFGNVASGLESQFTMIRPSQSSTYNVPYDYSSVMHYGKSAFSSDRSKITIEPIQSQYLNVIGRAKDMSQSDILKVNRMYNCNGIGSGQQDNGSGGQPSPVPTPAPSCFDRSTLCLAYVNYCQGWDLLKTYCRRTCKFC